jgi:hypothetical protein
MVKSILIMAEIAAILALFGSVFGRLAIPALHFCSLFFYLFAAVFVVAIVWRVFNLLTR